MRLDDARLCLDCEEIHEEQECPACGSEAFAFLTRWIQSTAPARPAPRPAPGPVERAPGPAERPARRPEPDARDREQLAAWRQIVSGEPEARGRGRQIVARGLLSLAAAGLAGWAWSRSGDKDEGRGTKDEG